MMLTYGVYVNNYDGGVFFHNAIKVEYGGSAVNVFFKTRDEAERACEHFESCGYEPYIVKNEMSKIEILFHQTIKAIRSILC